ncbi:MAG: hypothetical protein ACYDCO_11850 [Armatimonadota bacterium]
MSDLIVLLILTAFVLGYVSLLLFIRLGSLGVARGRIIGIVIELWLTFALIIGVFALMQQFIGPVPEIGFPGEFQVLIQRLSRLPSWQRLLIFGGFIAALVLFVHWLWSFNAVQRDAPRAGQPPDEE